MPRVGDLFSYQMQAYAPGNSEWAAPLPSSARQGTPTVGIANAGKPPVDNQISPDRLQVFNAVESFLDLGNPRRLDKFNELKPEQRQEFAKILAALIKRGVFGYEVLEVDGRPERHYVDVRMADERLRGAKLYDHRGQLYPY